MNHKNLEKMIEYASVSNDLEKRDKYLNDYKKRGSGSKKMAIFAILILIFLFGYYNQSSYVDTIFLMKITIPIFLLIFGLLIYFKKRFSKKVSNIKNNNEPLLCFESEIIKIDKVEKVSNYGNWPNSWWEYYIILNNEIKIEILDSQYKDFLNKKVTKVKIYFFESFLLDNMLYNKILDIEVD